MRFPQAAAGPTGVVFDIQRYSLGDGPGIRTTVFMKGCMLRCRWCQNPESLALQPEIAFRRERCIHCGTCLRTCRKGAIRTGEGYRVDPDRCDTCGMCAGACPTKALFILGQLYTVTELLSEVQADALFYAASGGGVTLSGGEPTLQFDFVRAFLQACKEAGMRTAIETNGFVEAEKLRLLLPWLDQVYFDLKFVSPDEHRQNTGVDNGRILQNACWLASSGIPLTFRVPVVPGITDTASNIHAIACYLRRLGVTEVGLCPYQDSWERKLSWLHTAQAPLGKRRLTPTQTGFVIQAFASEGILAHTADQG